MPGDYDGDGQTDVAVYSFRDGHVVRAAVEYRTLPRMSATNGALVQTFQC